MTKNSFTATDQIGNDVVTINVTKGQMSVSFNKDSENLSVQRLQSGNYTFSGTLVDPADSRILAFKVYINENFEYAQNEIK